MNPLNNPVPNSASNPRLLDVQEVSLSPGGTLKLEVLEPPTAPRVGKEFADFANRFLLEPFLLAICRGRWTDTLSCRVYRGTIDGQLVATSWVGWSMQRPGIGVVGGVATHPMHRKQGICTTVCGMLCDDFDALGGSYLYLAAATPVAQRVYERLGFHSLSGPFMVRCKGDLPPEDAFAPGGTVRCRPVTWGDVGNVMPLFSLSHPCILADAATQFVSLRVGESNRCVGRFWRMWHAYVEHGGYWHVLENDRGRIVASVAAQPMDHEHRVDFLWHPNYESEGRAFVREFVEQRAKEASCRMVACAEDVWKLTRAEEMGFVRTRDPAGSVELDIGRLELINLCWRP